MYINLSGQLTDVRERLARVETRLEYALPRPADPAANQPPRDSAEEIRTPDLCIANAALSQLSYGPTARYGLNHPAFGAAWPYCFLNGRVGGPGPDGSSLDRRPV